jgi:hypothetical protein
LPKSIPISRVIPRYKDISTATIPGNWFNSQCLIIGGGPSLSEFNPKLIEGHLSIGVNKAFLSFDTNINFSMDYWFYDSLQKESKNSLVYQRWAAYKGLKLFLRQDNKSYGNDVYTVKKIEMETISDSINNGIYCGSNSGLGAIMVAISLGAKKIGLLGFDMLVDNANKKTHWHPGYKGQSVSQIAKVLDGFKESFERVAPKIKAAGVSVINLNSNSGLKCFEFGLIGEFLR